MQSATFGLEGFMKVFTDKTERLVATIDALLVVAFIVVSVLYGGCAHTPTYDCHSDTGCYEQCVEQGDYPCE